MKVSKNKNTFRLGGACLLVLVAMVIEVYCEPPVGGYPDSLQNVAAYGPPRSGGNHHGGKGGYDDGKHEPANYDFQYEVFGGGNFFGHQESRRDQQTKGKYHVLLPDGRKQTVNYIADETGYHPTITYELIGSGDGGYAGGNSKGAQGGYDSPNKPSNGYGSPNPSSQYGLPQTPNSAYGTPGTRSKRLSEQDQFDLVRVYRPQNNPDLRFRNRRRRYSAPTAPKKMYLVVYPDGASALKQDQQLNIETPEN